MSKAGKGGGGSGKGSSMFAGVMVGMVLGLAVAGGVAWYILKKNPASFESKEHREAPKAEVAIKPVQPEVAKAAPAPAPVSAPAAASAVAEQPKQHFEFYRVLTDKPDGSAQKSHEKAVTAPKEPQPVASKPTPAANLKETYYVQAGSFPNEGDAEKLKAKLALLGLEANLQTAEIPDRGTYHRVRLGPYKGSEEANKTLAMLKQNGVANATSFKAQ
jgi:cell division protein FtsN